MRKENKQQKIPKSFFVALIITVLFWMLTKLSQEYQTVIAFPVTYVNIPQDKILQSPPIQNIQVQVKASGFKLFSKSVFKDKIKLDLKKLKRNSSKNYYLLIENLKIDIQHQVSADLMVNAIEQDTVFLDLKQLTSKKVALKGVYDFAFKLGYHLTKGLVIKPDSILVSGPKNQIDTLQHLYLEKFEMKEVSKSIEKRVKISELSEVLKFDTKEVLVYGEVDRFTEGNLTLPFEIINLPDSVTVKTFPKKIQLFYQVGLSNFNNINEGSFKVVCDYKNSLNNNLNYLIPKVILQPEYVTSVKINPSMIEYLIQK